MVKTRRSKALEQIETNEINNDDGNNLNQVVNSPNTKEEPQQVSSSSSSSSSTSSFGSENEDGTEQDHATTSQKEEKIEPLAAYHHYQGHSRLFSPYRTLGIVSHGPFHLLPNQNSTNATVCAAIGERFHLLQCDKLQPVMVSHAVPGPATKASTTVKGKGGGQPQTISHVVSDNSLSITAVSHGGSKVAPRYVTLFHRTLPIHTLSSLCDSKEWTIVDMLQIGTIRMTMSGEKKGKRENAALIAVVLSKGQPLPDDGIPVVGEEDDDDDDDDSVGSSGSSSSDEDSDSDDDTNGEGNACRGQVVLVVASRTALTVHKRIELSDFSSFCPRVAIHPPTYVNKIVIGGSCSKTSSDAMILLNIKSGRMIHIFQCLAGKSKTIKSEITSLEASPAIDTIAVGTSKGMVHLVNTRSDQHLFSLHHKSRNGKPTRITSMSFRTDGSALQYGIAPLAVGRADGTITVWDLTPAEDEEESPLGRTLLCEMERVHYPGGVHKLQYMPQEPLLLSTGTHSNSIRMHIFDNPDHSGRVLRERRGHTSSPKHIRYLHPGAGAGGGVLVNAADGTDASACQILSSGGADRTLRIFSTVRSVLDKEYSQGRGLEKRARALGMSSKTELLLPPVTALVTAEARSRDWGDLVTIHSNHAFAYVWSTKRGAQAGPILRQDGWNVSAMKAPPPPSAHATSVAMSTCGNFALIGTKGGTIYKYNVQSGHARGSYPIGEKDKSGNKKRRDAGDIKRTFKTLEKKMKIANRAANVDKEDRDKVENARKELRRAEHFKMASHAGSAVTGIAVDGVNKTVVSVGADAKLILWNFKTYAPHKKSPFKLPAAATKLCHVRDSDLAAIALEDFSALLFDCSTLSIVRRFGCGNKSARHLGPITDLGFSPDGRTLYTSSLDGTIRVWDVPTNSCLDWLSFSSSPTSLTVSPTGEFLATTHTGKLGISLWSDRSFYQTVHVDGARPLDTPANMDDPAPIAEVEDEKGVNEKAPKAVSIKSLESVNKDGEGEEAAKGPATAKEEGLITLSGLPPAHWKNLFHLELVKQRNKPKEPPKKPPTAPFFLQWRPSVSLTGESIKNKESADKDTPSDGEWDAVWSDDDEDNHDDAIVSKQSVDKAWKRERDQEDDDDEVTKRPKVTHYRSHLAALLEECARKEGKKGSQFMAVTDHIATLGPSAIDVSLSTLCNGMHDLEEGLHLLVLTCRWLIEACQSRERFEAVNAYLHRFLHLHSGVLAGIDASSREDTYEKQDPTIENKQKRERQDLQRQELLSSIRILRNAQRGVSEELQSKMQNTLCLLRHFSRMV